MGSVTATVLGVAEIFDGGAAFIGGGAVCGTGVLCPAGVAISAAGVVVGAHGVAVAVVGVGDISANFNELMTRIETNSRDNGGASELAMGPFQRNGIRVTDHFPQRLKEWGVTEQEAFDVYQNGQKWMDERGQFIRWDPKKGLGVVVDPTDGGVITILDQPDRPRGWTRGWIIPEE